MIFMVVKGTLYLCSVKHLDLYEVLDNKYFISRYVKDSDSLRKYGFVQVKDLAPSEALVKQYLNAKRVGEWNEEAFDSWFTPAFRSEIKTSVPLRNALNQVYKLLKSGQDVVLACYCHDANLCHRRLIGEEFVRLGFNVSNR